MPLYIDLGTRVLSLERIAYIEYDWATHDTPFRVRITLDVGAPKPLVVHLEREEAESFMNWIYTYTQELQV